MMRFARPSPKQRHDPILPLINVVFLLLVFFMLVAQITTPPPVRIEPPVAEAELLEAPSDVFYVTADGAFYFGAMSGNDALEAVAGLAPDAPLTLAVDSGFPAQGLAALLADIGPREGLTLTVAR